MPVFKTPWRSLCNVYFSTVGRMDHHDADCFVLIILSHGVKEGVYGVDGVISPVQLIEPIKGSNCPGLIGKPKLIFIQVTITDFYLQRGVILCDIARSTTP